MPIDFSLSEEQQQTQQAARDFALGRLAQATQEMAEKVANGPTQAFGLFKKLVDSAFTQPLKQQLADERVSFKATSRTDDFRAGVTAFLNKGKATSSGK